MRRFLGRLLGGGRLFGLGAKVGDAVNAAEVRRFERTTLASWSREELCPVAANCDRFENGKRNEQVIGETPLWRDSSVQVISCTRSQVRAFHRTQPLFGTRVAATKTEKYTVFSSV